MFEVVWESRFGTEVVDEAETKREAEYLKREYQMAFREGRVFIRQRSKD